MLTPVVGGTSLTHPPLGDQISLADMQLGPWLARVAAISGVDVSDTGAVALAKIEARVGSGFVLPRDFESPAETQRTPTAGIEPPVPAKQARLAAFWDAIRERPSWQKVYGSGLH
jgi:glutathione S-transferase